MAFVEVKKDINTITGDYDSGYSPIAKKGPIKLTVEDDKLIFSGMLKKYHKVDVRDIKNVLFKSEQEISKDVTLTRLIALGIFAFGLKKKRKKDSYYIIITTEEDGFENDFVLEVKNSLGVGTTLAQEFVKTLKNTILKYN